MDKTERSAIESGLASMVTRQHTVACTVPDFGPERCGWTGTSPAMAGVHTGNGAKPVYGKRADGTRYTIGHRHVALTIGAQRAKRRDIVGRAIAHSIVASWLGEEESE